MCALATGVVPFFLATAAQAQVCDPLAAAHEWAARAQLELLAQRNADAERADARSLSYASLPSVELEASPLFDQRGETELHALGVWTWDLARSPELTLQLGDLRAAAAMGELDLQRATASATVLAAYGHALDVDTELAIVDSELTYLHEVHAMARALVEGGEAGELDLLRIEQRIRSAAMLRDAATLELVASRQSLATLAPDTCGVATTLSQTPFPVAAESPRMAALEASLAALRTDASLAARSARPELAFGAGPRLVVGSDGVAPGAVLSLSYTPRRAAQRRDAEARIAADTDRIGTLAQFHSAAGQLATPWIVLAEQLDALALSSASTREDEAERILTAVRVGYAGGELDLSAVLDAHDALANEARLIASVRSRARAARLRALTLLLGDAP